MEEIWKDIKGYGGLYQVSNLGRIKSLDRYVQQKNKYGKLMKCFTKGKIKTLSKDRNGYIHVVLNKNGKYKVCRIHRLVAEAFIPNPQNKSTVNHIDGNKKNNKVDNLEYCTLSENHLHAYRTGL